jgi:hypothetical protein
MKHSAIEQCRKFTDEKLGHLTEALTAISSPEWALIANGSYGRKEATPQSDFDYFILHRQSLNAEQIQQLKGKVRALVKEQIGRLPATDGAFGAAHELGNSRQKHRRTRGYE